eukprot:3427840-Pyramimonas_sp.AAC.1
MGRHITAFPETNYYLATRVNQGHRWLSANHATKNKSTFKESFVATCMGRDRRTIGQHSERIGNFTIVPRTQVI